MLEQKLQIAFKGSDDYRRWLQEEAHKRRIKVQQMIEDALNAYLASPEPPSPTPISTPDLALTVQAPTYGQWRLLAATAAMMSDPELCEVHVPVLEALLAPQLRKIPTEPGPGAKGKRKQKYRKQEDAA